LKRRIDQPASELLCRTLAEAWVRSVLARCLAEWSEAQLLRAHGQDPQQTAIGPALTYIEEHLAERFSNAQLAKQCVMSQDHFIRRFRQWVGQTPARYTTQRRIAQAVPMLLHSDWSIERIAQAVGFADRFHFSRVFAARMGAAPARYRKQQRL
jgi:transcriptional regulator GlxA family with amidase domain